MKNACFLLLLILSLALLSMPVLAGDSICTKPEDAYPLPGEAKVSERIFSLKGISNAGRVSPCIYRGAQPDKEGYATLKKMGIRTVINLRTSKSEKKDVESAGMKSIEVPMSVFKDVKKETIDKIIGMIKDPGNQPVYVHCKHGQDRTGIVIAAYRMKVDGWSLKEAEEEMQAFGFNDIWRELKEFIRDYAKEVNK